MYDLVCGDSLGVLPYLPDGMVDAVITDPPYAEVDRDYGRLSEDAWTAMMKRLVPHVRQVLKPQGSAVFILQPNSERLGRMRPWLWDFMAWVCREWNQIQDVWWWNHAAIPEAHAIQGRLLRPSLKACVWCGPPDCWRDQDAVLWTESQGSAAQRLGARFIREKRPSGHGVNRGQCCDAAVRRGGVTPFNVLPFPNASSTTGGGAYGHPAATPESLCRWWVRYICPPGGLVLDPFSGTAMVGLATLAERRRYLGIEKEPAYHDMARKRLAGIRAGREVASC